MDTPPLHAHALATLLELTRALATEVRLDRILEVIVEKTTLVLDAERTTLFLYDQTRDELWSRIAEGINTQEIRFPADRGLAGFVARTRTPLRLTDAYADPRFNPAIDGQTGFCTRSVLCLPIIDRDHQLLGVLQVLNRKHGTVFTEADEALLEAFCSHAALALEGAMLVDVHVEQQRMQETLKLAHDIQMDMLPTDFPVPPQEQRFELHAALTSAQMVGGDLYDFFKLDAHRLGFALGDVSGKGVPASLMMVKTHTLLRAFGPEASSPDRCLQRINQAQHGLSSLFVTLFYGVLDTRTGHVDYCNAGHHPPVLLRRNGQASFLPRAKNLPLSRFKDFAYQPGHLTLEPGDLLLLYTDGLVEALAPNGEAFGEARLLTALTENKARSPKRIIQALGDLLQHFTEGGPLHDDIALLAVRFNG